MSAAPLDPKHCRGCVDDFYNQSGLSPVGACWHLETAKLTVRYRLGTWVSPLERRAFIEMRVPTCYRQKSYVFQDAPHPEAVDVVRLPVLQ